jgi:hypothetical protein
MDNVNNTKKRKNSDSRGTVKKEELNLLREYFNPLITITQALADWIIEVLLIVLSRYY